MQFLQKLLLEISFYYAYYTCVFFFQKLKPFKKERKFILKCKKENKILKRNMHWWEALES